MFVHRPTNSLVLKLEDPQTVLKLLGPHARPLAHAQGNIVIRHSLDAVRVLRNMGIEAPSPIWTDYNWPGKYRPYDHQRVMADVMTVHPRCFNLSEMGTAKTAAALWAADYLMNIGQVKRAVVLCPLSTMYSVWQHDLFEVLLHRRCAVVHGSRERRLKMLGADVDFYILNHDGISLDYIAETLRKRRDIDLVILDEASVFRNHRTNNYRFLQWVLAKQAKRFWLLTGTPTPTEPPDAWALARLICPERVPEHKGEFWRQTMFQINDQKAKPKRGYEKIVYDAMQPAVRFEKAKCLSLPPLTTIIKETRMTKAQRSAFDAMQKQMMAEVAAGVKITAVHAADALNKLRQILCGAVLDKDTGKYQILPHTERLNDLVDTMNEAKAKGIIIVPFKGIIQVLERELTTMGYSIGVLNGDVSVGQRKLIIEDFKNKAYPRWLLCHPRVMAHGLNLTEADMTIFYAPIYSYDEYAQVIERFNRPGQTRKMTVARMGAHALEWKIYRKLDERGITQQNVLDLYEEVTVGE